MKKIIMLALTLLALTACVHTHTHTHDTHTHEDKLQLTAYNDRLEAYAEATPLVVGQESNILVHLTHLDNFKPLQKGKVTLSLNTGNHSVSQTADTPSQPGIYSLAITPAAKGNAKMCLDVETDSGTSRLTIDNIRVFDNEHDANHDAASKTATSSNGVAFSKETSWKVDFATEECRKELLGKTIRTMARIEPTQSGQHIISAKGCGIVTFTNNKHITEGTSVAKGQTLFHISGGDLADNNLALRYQETESNYNLAKKEYERKSQLFEEQIVSENELLQAKHNFDTAEASYNNLKRTFANNQQNISTPTEGYISQLMVRNGEYVETGQTLAVITKNNTLYVKALLQPRNYHTLKNATSANFRQTNSNKTYTLEELDGRLISYGKTISADNPLLPVVYQIKNNADFLPGTFVELYIKTTGTEENITVPNTALVEEMGNYFVYVQLTPEYFEKREVKTGTTDGKRTAILNGIKTGERIVSKGAILVKLAQTTNTLDAHAGHVH